MMIIAQILLNQIICPFNCFPDKIFISFIIPGIYFFPHEFVFTGTNVPLIFDKMKDLYDEKKDTNGKWRINVVVYDNGGSCGRPSPPDTQTARTIVGFATLIIEDVFKDPLLFNLETVKGKVLCETAEDGRGIAIFGDSGLYYGTMGSIPSLVK